MNLISNSFKFTNRGGIDIYIDVKSHSDASGERHRFLKFKVIDTGVGISREHSKNLFRMFNVLKRDTLNSRGTGLGLTISKKLTELLGGEIKVKSEENKGTEISFTIKEVKDEEQSCSSKFHNDFSTLLTHLNYL